MVVFWDGINRGKLKALYNKKKKLINQLNEIGGLLDKEIEKRFGFHYSQTDDDEMIDTLDYGTQDLPYHAFIKKMNEFKKLKEDGEWTPNH